VPFAYAYLRKSRVFRDQEAISPEMQLDAAEQYAAQFGDHDLIVLTDMNLSGRKGRRERPGFDALLSAIEAGEVSAIYSYSLSRLSRSVRDIMALADLCKAHRVPIRLARDTDPDPTTATGRAVLAILGVMAQLEADLASERALDAVEARRARGDTMGTPVFANHPVVLSAYAKAGSYTGAAKILTAAGVPTRNGNALWFPSAVRVIVQRTAPELMVRGQPRGTKIAAPFLFYRLLRCHCGMTLTGWRRPNGYVSYRCTRGRLLPGHGKTHIVESHIVEWAMREAERLRPPTDRVALAQSTEGEMIGLRERLARLKVGFLAGLVSEDEMRAEKREIDDDLTRLDLQGRAVYVPGVMWDREPRDVNRALRAIWGHVQLGRDLRPASVEWLLPASWLAPPPA
jgi:DNA invertase Pin-like site-specific DNA recombinase